VISGLKAKPEKASHVGLRGQRPAEAAGSIWLEANKVGKANTMSTTKKKCAHLSCQCEVTSSEKYCGEICKEAGAGEVEIGCECGHTACSELVGEQSRLSK
jgi:hypothetical protein